jgi:LL-diaminopimelate aminotransferase
MSTLRWEELFAERIGGRNYGKGTEIYKFEKIKRAKRAALADFPDRPLIDFGIGENDDMAAESVRAVMHQEIDKVENRGYADNGIQAYKDAAAAFMQREFGVTLDPQSEINHCIGSKTALAMIPAAFINPGDITLMTVPGYPVAGTATKYLGGDVYNLPLTKKGNFLPVLEEISDAVLERAKLLIVNYPNSPTGALADKAFFERLVRFAHAHRIAVINDAAHIMLTYGKPPLSFLQVDGAKDIGAEIHSMSKGFNMIGWRLGFVCGNPNIVRPFADIKDNSDSGQFMAIQKAGAAALADAEIPRQVRAKYERRLRKLVSALQSLGFQAEMPGGTYFLYAKSPKKVADGPEFKTAEDCSQFLIRERSICTVPWDNAGAFLRFSVTYQAAGEQQEDELMAALSQRLQNDRFIW